MNDQKRIATLFTGKRTRIATYKSLKFNETPKLWPGFSLSEGELKDASFEDFLSQGLGAMIAAGLAKDFGECANQHFVAYPPTAINNWEGFDLLNCVFPTLGAPLVRMTDELNEQQVEYYRIMVNACLSSFQTVAARRAQSFERLYFLQHIAPYQQISFRNSYPHLHSHAFGFLREAKYQGAPSSEALRTFHRHHLFFEPFIDVIGEIFEHDLDREIHIDPRTHSVVLNQRTLEGLLSTDEMELITQTSRIWKHRWWQIASCFTDLQSPCQNVHDQQRLDEQTIVRNLDRIFSEELCFLSNCSKARLQLLAARLTKTNDWRDTDRNWKNVMNGPYGSIGVVFDFDRQVQELRVAPRTFGATRTGATDGTWMTLKRRDRAMEEQLREAVFQTTHALIRAMGN